ncbi:hypothetical protein CDAR_405341 [Caerostris darwini]|uniref:Uncharacterized protein n=1 Tax=Caerostris darwini TaxID=1538125 RepID=A0AAV4QKA3_9ARAC|nr:hypothetical protein CDAR_405341 [Caerostris darwini]
MVRPLVPGNFLVIANVRRSAILMHLSNPGGATLTAGGRGRGSRPRQRKVEETTVTGHPSVDNASSGDSTVFSLDQGWANSGPPEVSIRIEFSTDRILICRRFCTHDIPNGVNAEGRIRGRAVGRKRRRPTNSFTILHGTANARRPSPLQSSQDGLGSSGLGGFPWGHYPRGRGPPQESPRKRKK